MTTEGRGSLRATARCTPHGLAYDPSSATGCVLCRREGVGADVGRPIDEPPRIPLGIRAVRWLAVFSTVVSIAGVFWGTRGDRSRAAASLPPEIPRRQRGAAPPPSAAPVAAAPSRAPPPPTGAFSVEFEPSAAPRGPKQLDRVNQAEIGELAAHLHARVTPVPVMDEGASTGVTELVGLHYQNPASIPVIQSKVLRAAIRGNVVAANVARQTFHVLGQEQQLAVFVPVASASPQIHTAEERQWWSELNRKAEAGDPFFLLTRAAMRFEGHGVPKDVEAALDDARSAERRGLVYAKVFLGKAYYAFEEMVDLPKGLAFLEEAGAAGNPEAWFFLADAASEGVMGPKDPSRAASLWRRSAEAGYLPAQVLLARSYRLGDGITLDRGLAERWLRLAAAQGWQEALDDLGVYFPK